MDTWALGAAASQRRNVCGADTAGHRAAHRSGYRPNVDVRALAGANRDDVGARWRRRFRPAPRSPRFHRDKPDESDCTPEPGLWSAGLLAWRQRAPADRGG